MVSEYLDPTLKYALSTAKSHNNLSALDGFQRSDKIGPNENNDEENENLDAVTAWTSSMN